MEKIILEYLLPFTLFFAVSFFGVLKFLGGKALERIKILEERVSRRATRNEVKDMIEDKTKDLQRQLTVVDAKLDRIISIMLTASKRAK